ncbi:hypothetical protein [Taibaiella soli]|uniref:hypothetical protein n=1 Tax=Taibaiella soli TaxID=1649169 RepID=UPI000F506125|nr:hypothetical protein [Taibaiella soli]
MDQLSSIPFGHPAFVRCTEYPAHLLGEYSNYQSLKEAITNYLIGLAKVGSKCTFRELYTALNIPLYVTYSYHRKLIGLICSEINGEQWLQGRPLIGVLLCGETDGYITGKGFFLFMDYPEFCEGFNFDKENITHQAAFFGIHARKCWLYWLKRRKDDEKKSEQIQKKQTGG